MSGDKELAYCFFYLFSDEDKVLTLIKQVFDLHAQVECLGIFLIIFGLNASVLLNWVRFRPGICDGEATSFTESWG